jgi:hypothetical protein
MTAIRITQLDGKIPNMALMRLASYWRAQGAEIVSRRSVYRQIGEPAHYDHVYASAIFAFTAPSVAKFREQFPEAVIGGTWNLADNTTVEDVIGEHDGLDYSIFPGFTGSIGFTQRGCRLKCGFCVVPKKEGKNRTVASIADIWRGPGHAKHLHLLDNDFFGQPEEQWRARVREIVDGKFKVCLNQGINVRLLDDAGAEALAAMDYRDDSFTSKRIYTAWDNIGDEERFFTGMARLQRAGIPPGHIMAFMLIGYDRRETWERLFYRYQRMKDLGIRPYPMLFEPTRKRGLDAGSPAFEPVARRGMRLQQFQRWVNGRYSAVCPDFAQFEPEDKALTTKAGKELATRQMALF